MIVYSAQKNEFLDDVLANVIKDKIVMALKARLGHSVGPAEINAYQNSMMYMNLVLADQEIPDNAKISIEYRIPQTSKRVDFIITGVNGESKSSAIIIELKQWSKVELTDMDAVVRTYVGGAIREVSHPSYQAWSYTALLQDFNSEVQDKEISLLPCAYLHNYEEDGIIDNDFYSEYIDKAPLFLKDDATKLREFIKKHIKFGDEKDIMFEIDHGRIRPSKNLADVLSSLLQGNQEFVMIDDQKIVYETALRLAKESNAQNKNVLIVEGGPGTGKSVVAINLLVSLTNHGQVTQYVTKNAAPRAVYESKLAKTMKKTQITNLFSGSGAFTDTERNLFDTLIVDEAHRLNAKSGMFQNLGENQIKEIINSSKFSIFFIDEDQKVTLKDIGEKDEIVKYANELNARVTTLELNSQFRCNGSDGYLAWLDNALQIRETANTTLEGINYDFKIADTATELKELIYEKNKEKNKARMVAGYCWDWVSKNSHGSVDDIVLDDGEFSARWNLASDGNLWIIKPESVSEVGCIHTCQGLELDYIGVIIGPDMTARAGMIETHPEERAKTDASLKGYKRLVEADPINGKAKVDAIIKNTYRTLMTRGMKGCCIYFTDLETRKYFEERMKNENSG